MVSKPENELNVDIQIERLVHEPARLKILAYLSVVESADFVFLISRTGLTMGNLSAHMSKLEKAGYIVVEKEIKDNYSFYSFFCFHSYSIQLKVTRK